MYLKTLKNFYHTCQLNFYLPLENIWIYPSVKMFLILARTDQGSSFQITLPLPFRGFLQKGKGGGVDLEVTQISYRKKNVKIFPPRGKEGGG